MIYHRDNCRGCFSKDLFEFLDLGKMPLAGGFLDEKEISKELKFPLKVNFCNDCGLVQILDVPDTKTLFQNYFYVSSVIGGLSGHFREYSVFLKKRYLKDNSQILEFGCNDGVLLQYFKDDKKIRSIGIDVSENITNLARKKGFDVITGKFNTENAELITKRYGQMDVVTGSNVFAHVDDIHEIIKAAKLALKPNGVFIVEVHYLKDLMEVFQYDTIYHEHLCYYSIGALKKILGLENMKIIDVIHLPMHGGVVRVVCSMKNSSHNVEATVNKFIEEEKRENLDKKEHFINFGKECMNHKKQLLALLDSIKKRGKTIVGYGAPGRGTILLNYCGIDKKYIGYIVDISPLRAGKFMPGVHVPIIEEKRFMDGSPDYALILAWSYKDEILNKESAFIENGGKFIMPFPKIEVIPQDAP